MRPHVGRSGPPLQVIATRQRAFVLPILGLRRLAEVVEDKVAGVSVESRLVYGGSEAQDRTDARVVPWNRMLELDWA